MKNSNQEKAEKKKFSPPKIEKYGDLAKMTKTGQTTGGDGFAGSGDES